MCSRLSSLMACLRSASMRPWETRWSSLFMYVRLEPLAVAPAAHHHKMPGVAIRLPDLKVHKAVTALNLAGAATEGGNELRCLVARDAKGREGNVHSRAQSSHLATTLRPDSLARYSARSAA